MAVYVDGDARLWISLLADRAEVKTEWLRLYLPQGQKIPPKQAELIGKETLPELLSMLGVLSVAFGAGVLLVQAKL